ncbi:ROOT PRIMORDIUM DEFECTIVE 1 protein [Nymphaea thermarum]|nr:ROOT PRIMORDIUM DEFECTIVE 1 protein [Nymphaea thermarum]
MVALQNPSLVFHQKPTSPASLSSSFVPPQLSSSSSSSCSSCQRQLSVRRRLKFTVTAAVKIIRNRPLDRVVEKHNRLRFVTKLKTLLLSKPHHHLPISILSKCRSYLSFPPSRPLPSMIARYPSIFELYHHPTNDLPSVRLTPAALAVAAEECALRSHISDRLAIKLQKLLMLSKHRRLLLDKLVHLAPDLGLPPNFRSRLCNEHPSRFRIVDSSYGRALELVAWDPDLAVPFPPPAPKDTKLIFNRPPRFKRLRLPKGVNLKRKHRDYLLKLEELPAVSPYSDAGEFNKLGMREEKRACAVVREVLAMMVEKRTLVDHLTHFRRDFGLSNKVRGMLVRHPELFYVSLKGVRDSVFLVEGYDDGNLVEKDELLVAKERLVELVREGKRMRKLRRQGLDSCVHEDDDDDNSDDSGDEVIVDDDDGLEELVRIGVIGPDWEEVSEDDDEEEEMGDGEVGEFWSVGAVDNEDGGLMEPW